MKTERLTARSPKNNLAYLVKVKPNEQAVESSFPNTLHCIQQAFERLAQYEEAFQNTDENIEMAIGLLQDNDYVVHKLTKSQIEDMEECESIAADGGEKDCTVCSCSCCILTGNPQ